MDDLTSNVFIDQVFDYVNERESVRMRKEAGVSKPWTIWPELLENRFCNVYREDDKTTAWFRKNMRNTDRFGRLDWHRLITTIAFRWFNKIEIGNVLMDSAIGLPAGQFRIKDARERIMFEFPKGPFVTGAYVVKTPDGMNKLDGVLHCINRACEMASDGGYDRLIREFQSLEYAHSLLTTIPFLGPFMAYEVVTDLAETPLLENATDRDTWANPGPGAARGASRILYSDPDKLSRSSRVDRERIMGVMQAIMKMANEGRCESAVTRPWHMREAEHLLCEVDKLFRVREGGRMKQKYLGRS